MNIATAKDLDFLLAQLKGDKSEALLQAIEEAQEEVAELVQEETKAASENTEIVMIDTAKADNQVDQTETQSSASPSLT